MNRLKSLRLPTWSFPLVLLGFTLLAYGLLFPFLGFYWDEWPMTWIAQKLGPDGLARYFATNRPYWGMLYRLTTPILGAVPWHWQLFGLFWRWMTAVGLWGALRQVWPRRADAAAFTSLLFLAFPGFGQQSIGMMYGHFFIVLSAYTFSLWFSLLSVRAWPRSRPRAVLLGLAALTLALLNLLAMEYFFLLELLRPLLIYAALRGQEQETENRAPLRVDMRRSLLLSLPYLALFLGAAAWRAFFFPYQTQNYRPALLSQLSAAPGATLLNLAGVFFGDLFQVTFGAWARAFRLPDVGALGSRTTLLYAAVTVAAGLLVLVALLFLRRSGEEERGRQRWAAPALLLGLAALLLAGPPFWLTQLPVTLDYPNDRFTLPFMLGSSLVMAGLVGLLPGRRGYKLALLGLALGMAAGLHFQQASAFRRDWNLQRALFWQMSWRVPALQPGATLVSSDLPLKYYSDNSLAGPLNWVYAPDNRSRQMSYMFYYASIRTGSHNLLKPGQPIEQNYLAAAFSGSTARMVALVFHPPACLRILDPDLDPLNTMLPELMREAAALSTPGLIQPEAARPPDLTPAIFGAEPARGWCYYFERAGLAVQQGDWQTAAGIGDLAFALDDYPNDPMERVPFIEAYAHTGNWGRAHELSREAGDITPLMQPVLCRLWQRIDEQLPYDPDKSAAVSAARSWLSCP